MANKVFFQDFLFIEMPVDEQDNPTVDIIYYSEKDKDESDRATVSLDKMLRMNKESEWEKLFQDIKGKKVIIDDDVPVLNTEVEPYKLFYLKAYYHNISKHCLECRVKSDPI